VPTVAIIGAGPLGRWLALEAARAGFVVLLEDVMPGNLHHAQEFIRQQLNSESLPTVRFVSTIEDAVRGADLVVDCIPDELESKLEILWLLDRMSPPQTVFATPTTKLSISDLASCTYRPEKCIAIVAEPQSLVAKQSNEVLLRTTALTAGEAISLVEDFWQRLGLVPRFERENGGQSTAPSY
jgi:3-hydroxybutyryl-CoA dehydrogenase